MSLIAERARLRTLMLDLMDRLQPLDPRFGAQDPHSPAFAGPMLALDGVIPVQVLVYVLPRSEDAQILLRYAPHICMAADGLYRPLQIGRAVDLIRSPRMPRTEAQALCRLEPEALCDAIRALVTRMCDPVEHAFLDTIILLACKRLWDTPTTQAHHIFLKPKKLTVNHDEVPLFPPTTHWTVLSRIKERLRAAFTYTSDSLSVSLIPFEQMPLSAEHVQRPSAHEQLFVLHQIRTGLAAAGIDPALA